MFHEALPALYEGRFLAFISPQVTSYDQSDLLRDWARQYVFNLNVKPVGQTGLILSSFTSGQIIGSNPALFKKSPKVSD